MKRFFTILFFLIAVQSNAQVHSIQKCRVIDSLTQELIADGNFFLTNRTDTLTTGSIKAGYFSMTCDKFEQQPILSIISNGYDTLRIAVNASFCLSDSVRVIQLKPAVKVLADVQVVSSLIRQDIDKITYNVSADPESKTLNLLEMMPKLPFVSLSPEDNPLLKGKSSYIVLLNGRRSSLFSGYSLRDALKSIPASTISRIEIFTDPPPRYENEGITGVINIITLKRQGDGYNASVNISAGTFISGGNASVNYRHNKFGAIVQGGINRERTPYNYSSTETYTPGFEVLQQGKNKVTNFSHYGNSVFSYEIDSLNLVTVDVGASGNILKNDVNNFGASRQTNNPLTSTYLFELDLQETGSQWNLNTNYQRNFRKAKDRFLTFSYLFRKSKTDNELLNVLAQQQNYDGNNYRQTSNGFVSNNALQLDYVHPVKNGRIETGAKYIYRNIDNSFSTTIIHPVSGVSFPDTANTDQLDYALSILGFYHSYQIKIKSFAFRAGFRLEHTSLDGNFKFGKQNITQDYNNLLPSARLQYRTEKSGLFSLSFRQQIQRPGLGLLNPLVIKTAPGYNQAGNPNLKPVLISFFSLEFSKYAKASTSLILNYTFSRNSIQSVSASQGDSLILTTFENIGQYHKYGVENSTEIPITSKIDLSIDGSLYYVTVNGSNNQGYLSNNGFEGFVYSYLTYRLKKFRFTANLGYYGPTVNIQAKSNSYLYSSIGGSMQVLKNNGNISLRVANPFQQYRTLGSEIKDAQLTQFNTQKNLFRGFYVSFNYKFGKLKQEVKQNKRSLQIDDAAGETGKIK